MDVQQTAAGDDDLAYLRENVPEYAGYGDEEARTHTDQRIRAYVGARLARYAERVRAEISEDEAEALDGLIFGFEFPDQLRVHDLAHADLDAAGVARETVRDRELVRAAERLDDRSAGEVAETVAAFTKLLSAGRRDRRSS